MARKDLWEHRLADLLLKAQTMPFKWGDHDCALFAAKAVEALTYEDIGASYRGRYSTAEGAKQILDVVGGLIGLMEMLSEQYGWAVIDPVFAHRGDIALADMHGRETLGVCNGHGFVFAAEPSGLVEIRRRSPMIRTVWRIE